MGDLLVFVGIVGLVAVGGIAVGMITATRLDRILTRPPRPSAEADGGPVPPTAPPATPSPAAERPDPEESSS